MKVAKWAAGILFTAAVMAAIAAVGPDAVAAGQAIGYRAVVAPAPQVVADDVPMARVPPPDSGKFIANPEPGGGAAPIAPKSSKTKSPEVGAPVAPDNPANPFVVSPGEPSPTPPAVPAVKAPAAPAAREARGKSHPAKPPAEVAADSGAKKAGPKYVAPPPHPSGRFDHIAPGEWYEVPDSHLRSVAPKLGPPVGDTDYNTRLPAIMSGFNGAGFDTKRNCLLVWGGGHKSYTGNEVYEFCLRTLKWKRLTDPSSYAATGNAPAWKDGDVKMPDGTPVNEHTYDGIEYLPTIDKFLVFGAYTFVTGKSSAGWLFDPKTKTWTMLPIAEPNLISVYDPSTKKVYTLNNYRMREYDPITGKWTLRVSGSYTWPDQLTAAIDPENHLLVAIGEGKVRAYDLSNPKPRWDDDQKTLVTSGDSDVIAATGPGFVWDPQIHKFVAWKGGADVYTLDPKTWVWTKIAPSPKNTVVPTQGLGTGTYGRFRYIPSEDLFLVVNSVDQNVYLYRLDNVRAGAAIPVPPPTIIFYASGTTLESGHAVTLTWRTSNAKSCDGSGAWSGNKPLSGTFNTLPLKDSRIFTLTCTGAGGKTTKSVPIKVLSEAEMADGVLHVCQPKDFNLKGSCEYPSFAAAARAVRANETILLAPGVYHECGVIRPSGVTVRGKGAHLEGAVCEDKGALDWKGDNGTVEGIECSGISISDGNGACIRIEDNAKSITLRGVYFHDNDEGVLGGVPGGKVLIENSRIEHNGRGGRAHGIYIVQGAEFTIRNSQVLSSRGEGHEVKSRAAKTVIENNIIAGLDGHDSREIDVPNGGEVVIKGNVIEKGPRSDNSDMIGIAREFQKGLHPKNSTLVENNIFIMDCPEGGTVLSSNSPNEIVFRNNEVVGARGIGVETTGGGNKMFVDRAQAGLKPFPALPPLP